MVFGIKKKMIAASLAGAFTLSVGLGASHGDAAQADRECVAQVALLQSLAQRPDSFARSVTRESGPLRD